MSKSHTVLKTVLLTSLVAFALGPRAEAAEPPDSSGAGKAGGDGAFFHIPIRVQPLDGKVTVVANGAQWNALIDFAKVVESSGEKTGASSAGEGAGPSLKPGARLPLVDELPPTMCCRSTTSRSPARFSTSTGRTVRPYFPPRAGRSLWVVLLIFT